MSAGTKRARSPSPPPSPPSPDGLFPTRSSKRQKPLDKLQEFAADLQTTVGRMLPTTGRAYSHAAILAIDFSVSDMPSVIPLRNELLQLMNTEYKWAIETYTIDCSQPWPNAKYDLQAAITAFTHRHHSKGSHKSLLCYYVSGHGFKGKNSQLNICGSYVKQSGQKPYPKSPYIPWEDLPAFTQTGHQDIAKVNHRLVIMDCCAAGLANLDQSEVEVLGASSWESTASASDKSCFTRALIDELKALKGQSITTTQLISALHTKHAAKKGMSMPVHKRATSRDEPALIHLIDNTKATLPQVKAVPRRSHVLLSVKCDQEDTIPNQREWAQWLSTNMPSYIGEIEITASWGIGSALIAFVVPIEIWLGFPIREAYVFMNFHYEWNAQTARQQALNLLYQSKHQQQGSPQRPPEMRSGNRPRPGPSSSGPSTTR